MSKTAMWRGLCAGLALAAGSAMAASPPAGQFIPTGQAITPEAARGAVFQRLNPGLAELPDFEAGQASATALSPDGKTLLVLTSGFNRNFGANGKVVPALSNEYVFLFDVSGARPVQRQAIPIANAFLGLAWAPAGDRFFVSAGVEDAVMEFVRGPEGFAAGRRIALGHRAGLGLNAKPEAGGLAVSPDGRRLLVANLQNDSVSLVDLAGGKVAAEQDLRPGKIDPARKGARGGTVPRAVVWVSAGRALAASERDREVIELSVGPSAIKVGRRIRTVGQPVAFARNRSGSRVYAALDNTDAVAVIDAARARLVETIATAGPKAVLPQAGRLGGAGSNALALSSDEATLFVSNGGENAVAVVRLGDGAQGRRPPKGDPDAGHRVGGGKAGDVDDAPPKARGSATVGLIPTGWYPTGVAVRAGGLFVVNGKSPPGANPKACRDDLKAGRADGAACQGANQYVWQLEKAGLLSLPLPGAAELGRLTRQVALNDHFPGSEDTAADDRLMAALRQRIRHVIYVVKENRSYDQMLGDLEVGNGDPRLVVLPEAISPNHHALAREFVTLDNFYDSGESSNTGWNWTTAARTNDWTEREAPVNYADRGLQYDQEGANRGINVGYPAEARPAANPLSPNDPDLLAGTADVAAPDGPGGEAGAGYIWDAALRAHKAVRNYGFYGDLTRYFVKPETGALIPLERDPRARGLTVLYPTKPALMAVTDPYYRGFDQAFPDFWRFQEWAHEYGGYAAAGKAPELMLVRLAHDHFGQFALGIDGVNTVEAQMADNDYALGLIVETVAKGPFAKDTLIFVVEDDAQDGPDHVDAHRSIAYVIGPYVKQHAVVSARYTTVSMLRTIEEVLGLEPMGLNDALARPMSAVFDLSKSDWGYRPRISEVLRATQLPLPPRTAADAGSGRPVATRSQAYWTAAMAGQDFREEDRLDTGRFNRALWRGLKGEDAAYPSVRGGQGRD
jgi:DNA-binding beta-propeller fold protein YncE